MGRFTHPTTVGPSPRQPAARPPGLAAWCKPGLAITRGSFSSYQLETAATYRVPGARVFHTPEVGAVHVTVSSTGLEVESVLHSD